MSAQSNDANASASALGYLYQLRYALWLALKNGADTSKSISIEKLDDVALFSNPTSPNEISASQALQLKHKINREGGTSNAHKDIWKTIRIWSKAVAEGEIDLDKCQLLLVTTATASSTHAISNFRDGSDLSVREKARKVLEAAGKKSISPVVTKGYQQLLKLKVKDRKKFFQAIVLVEASEQIDEIMDKIKRQIWMVADADRQPAFVERLEGWWFNVVVGHLLDATSHSIPLELVAAKVQSLNEQFKLDNLPDDLLEVDVPDGETVPDDPRTFVRQLETIGIGEGRIKKAQENHYKAATQRSKWIRDKIIDMDEIDKFELKLIGEWGEFAEIYNEGIDSESLETQKCKAGEELYKWSQELAPKDPSLFIRPLFRSAYLTRGSFQMLSDQVRVGWHADFKRIFSKNGDAA